MSVGKTRSMFDELLEMWSSAGPGVLWVRPASRWVLPSRLEGPTGYYCLPSSVSSMRMAWGLRKWRFSVCVAFPLSISFVTFWKKMRLKAFADFCASVTFNLFGIRTWMIFFFLAFSSLVDLSFVISGLFTSCLSQLLSSFPVIVTP